MADFPEHLDTGRHRDAPGRTEPIARRVLMTLLAGLAVTALFSLFGQTPERSVAAGERAELEVSAPSRLRGGLFYQGRFTIRPRAPVENAVLVLAPG